MGEHRKSRRARAVVPEENLKGEDVPKMTVSEILEPLPFSHFSREDHELFYSTMDSLLTYANEVMCVVDAKKITLWHPDVRVANAGMLVSEELFSHREVIDHFVRRNPCGLSDEQLDLARSWEYAVHDLFTCVGADEDCALYMGAECIFAVGAMEEPANGHVHAVPSLLMLTLLPFRGGIITNGAFLQISQQARPWAEVELMEQAREFIDEGRVITTSEDLLCYWLTHRGIDQISPFWQRQVDKYLGSLRLPNGTSRMKATKEVVG